MKAVHTINSLRSDHGGPSRSVTALCSALAQRGTDIAVVTHRRGSGEGKPVLPDDRVAVRFAEREPGYRAFLGRSSFAATVEQLAGADAVVHDHGLWLPVNHAVARAARRADAPRVVSVRGMLSAWALEAGRLKKRLAWWAYQRRDLQRAAVLHATSEAEVADIRRLGLRPPVALIPNGVDVPEIARSESDQRPTRRVLFLSRIHPVKGVMNLVQAWAAVRPAGWECVLAGPDVDGHRAEAEQVARERGVAGDLHFVGEVSDEEKWDLYRSADLFVLPTFSENFGIVVAEALAAGVPVITTKGAPWQSLEAHDCGWWTGVGVEPLARTLEEATGLTDAQRRAMGQRGRTLVERGYSWSHVAEEMVGVYTWLLGQGPRPLCIAQ